MEQLNLPGHDMEKKDTWAGVSIPTYIQVFDCRLGSLESYPTYQGKKVSLDELAEYKLGLVDIRGPYYGYSVSMLHCTPYIDLRTCSNEEIARQLTRALERAEEFIQEYHKAKRSRRKDQGRGGIVAYLPVAILVNNFGWSIVGDRRNGAIRYLGP